MSRFPVEINDSQGHTDAINYLLSGGMSLGQQFYGSTWNLSFPSYATGRYFPPFFDLSPVNLYINPISINYCDVIIGTNTFTVYFSTTQPSAPFVVGDRITIVGNSQTQYNVTSMDNYVTECTDTYCVVKWLVYPGSLPPMGSGGTIELINTNFKTGATTGNITYTGIRNQTNLLASGQINGTISLLGLDSLNSSIITISLQLYKLGTTGTLFEPLAITTLYSKKFNYNDAGGPGLLPFDFIVTPLQVDADPNEYALMFEIDIETVTGNDVITQIEIDKYNLSLMSLKQ